MRPATERFWEKVNKTEGCWLWTGNRGTNGGYGRFRVSTFKQVVAHRFAWEEVNGPIPAGMELDHLVCDTPPCVRVSHMRLATRAVNLARARIGLEVPGCSADDRQGPH